ncbi:MAG: hypothetical protein AABX24_00120 [Nanoarchaeota archaeon]
MSKRGQVTIFLVVGIVILLLAALFFYLFGQMKEAPLQVEAKETGEAPSTRGALQIYVENCIEKTIDPATYLLALQGGIIYPDESNKILLTDYGVVNYAWLNGAQGISRAKMEEDLAAYLEEYIPSCLGNFETFVTQNILVESDFNNVQAKISIKENTINANLDLPLKVNLADGDKLELDHFSAMVRSSLGKMLTSIEKLKFPIITPSDLVNLPYQSTIFPFDEAVTIYSLTEENQETPLSFMFAVRNDLPENKAPSLHYIADKTFRVGDVWKEVLTAEDPTNDLLEFSSDSSLFPIQKDGTIDVQITQAGEFEVTFSVNDHQAGEVEQLVTVTVVNKE